MITVLAFGVSACAGKTPEGELAGETSSGTGTDSVAGEESGVGENESAGEVETGMTDGTEPTETGGDGDGEESGDGDAEADTGECECEADEICSPDGCVAAQIFINLDGPLLTAEFGEDATQYSTSVPDLAKQLQGYGGDEEDAAELLAVVRDKLAGLPIYVSTEEGPFTMVVVGPNLADGPGNGLFFAVSDCNNQNENSVVFVNAVANSTAVGTHASLILRTFGYSIGLDRVDGTGGIMSVQQPPNAQFQTECVPFEFGICTEQHLAHCPEGQQNAWAELAGL